MHDQHWKVALVAALVSFCFLTVFQDCTDAVHLFSAQTVGTKSQTVAVGAPWVPMPSFHKPMDVPKLTPRSSSADSQDHHLDTAWKAPAMTFLFGSFFSFLLARALADKRTVVTASEFLPVTGDSCSQITLAAATGRKAPVVVSPSYNLAIGTAGVAALLAALPGSGLADIPAVIFGLLAVLFGVQTGRVKFCFDDEALEIRIGDDLKESGENIVVGGANRWKYRSFINWDVFPSRSFPILVYFKENQTPKEKWSEGPGQLDKVGGGQIHFFPAVCNVEQICQQFEERGCRTVRN